MQLKRGGLKDIYETWWVIEGSRFTHLYLEKLSISTQEARKDKLRILTLIRYRIRTVICANYPWI